MAILISVFAFFPVSGSSLVDVVVFTVPFVAAIVGIRGRVLLGRRPGAHTVHLSWAYG